MNRFAISCLFLLTCLPVRAATNLPPAKALLLDEKTVVELTAGHSQYENLPKLTGKLASGGSGLVTILIDRWASEFATLYPEVEFDIQGGGGTASLPAFMEGKMDLLPLSRSLSPDEVARFKGKFGYDLPQIVVAQDAVGIYVNKNNPLSGLTLVQLDGIYSRDAKRGGKRAEFWSDLGIAGPLADERIIRLCLSRVHGTHLFFRDEVMLGSDYRFGGHFEMVSSSLVQAVGADDAGIGFASVMWATARTRFVPLQAADGSYLLPSYEHTVNGRYPLMRPMRIAFHRKPDGTMNPVAREFLRFAVSRRGQRMSALAGSYPLTLEQQQEALRSIGEAPRGKPGEPAKAMDVPTKKKR
jgi:phosphate transport system substrate-binding protein